jgi:CCR4-NOT transcription complex subunit 7/8
MPPHGGRFPGHNLSNPFAHLSQPIHQQPQLQPHQQQPQQPQPQQQQQHQQHQQHPQSMQHPGFGGANPQHNLNLFSHNQGNFQSNAALASIGGGAAATLGGVSGGTGLDGHEARLRFAHGAQLQQDAQMGRAQDGTKGIAGQRIREVWRNNLHQEMELLRSLVEKYPYISMVSDLLPFKPAGFFVDVESVSNGKENRQWRSVAESLYRARRR